MNLSKFSTDAGYRDALTGSDLLKTIAADAQLPRPAHLDEPGPIGFERQLRARRARHEGARRAHRHRAAAAVRDRRFADLAAVQDQP